MSLQYDDYIEEHRENLEKAFKWLEENLPEVLPSKDAGDEYSICQHNCIFDHDMSKYSREEYDAYDKYFYGGNKSYEVVEKFNYAWLHHIHNNPHHWQYWVLINDDPDKGEIILDMPDVYIIEMICDWMSFSIKKGDINELFKFYKSRSEYMKLSDYTRKKVEDILEKIKVKVTETISNDKQ